MAAASAIFDALLEDPEVRALLADPARALAMVEVEVALARVQAELGVIPAEALAPIAAALDGYRPDLDDLAAGTLAAGVPVPALVAQLRGAVGEPAASFLHFGATSQDIVDTALVLQLRAVLEVLDARLGRLSGVLAALADRHRATVCVARTRHQQATPTTFGHKVVCWLAPLLRHRERLAELRPRLLVVQLGGAVGTLAAQGERGIAVMEGLARALGLGCPALPWHTQRDGLVELASWLAQVTCSLGKLGQDVLLLAQNEVAEVREAAGGGSSTMPQKANPIRSEALVALARRNATLAGGAFQAALHAQERDGAAWLLEGSLLPDMATATAAALDHAIRLGTTLVVDAPRMRANLDASKGLVLAEAASFALSRHMAHADAQALVGHACRRALAAGRDLLAVLAETTEAPVDWQRLRADAERPQAIDQLIDRVLQSVPNDEAR